MPRVLISMMHGDNQEYQPGEHRNPDSELYRQLRSLRIRHFRINLHERTIRLRQNSLIIAGLLSTVLIPLLMLAFMPANIFLRNTEFPGSLQMAALIQLLSWSIVLLQATALAHGPTERYLDTWPLNRDLRKKLDINILLLANHLLWLVTVPVLIWYLAVTANWSGNWPENWAGALLAGFKFVILLYFILVLQLRYLERQSMPWLGLFVANSVFSAGLFLIDRLPTPAVYVSLLLTPVVLHYFRPERTDNFPNFVLDRLTGFRRDLTQFAPWISLYLLMMTTRKAQPHRWRLVFIVLVIAIAGPAVSGLDNNYAFPVLLIMIFGVIYTVNGLYYYFEEFHDQSRPILQSWGVSSRKLLNHNLQLFFFTDVILVALMLINVWVSGGINAFQAGFAALCTLIYVPAIFFIAVRATENVLAYSMLAFFPACLGALILPF